MPNKNYHIMKNHPPLSDKEMESYMDFEAILSRQKVLKRNSLVKKGLLVSLFSIITAGTCFFFYPSQEETKTMVPKTVISPSKETNAEAIKPTTQPSLLPAKPKSKSKPSYSAPVSQLEDFSQAQPLGGYDQLFSHMEKQLKYPHEEEVQGIGGTVMVEFYINPSGKAEHIQVIKGVSPAIDQEAIRLVETMPEWKPAQLNGDPISTRQVLPIHFTIKKD